MSINILKELDNFSKKFDYNFKYRFIWIKFHQKNSGKLCNYKILMMKFKNKIQNNSWMREFECGKIIEWKKGKFFKITWNP